MQFQVLTSAKSPGISGGLTYGSDANVELGSMVRVPLRNKTVEGIVLGASEPTGDFDVKSITEALTKEPLLTSAHIRTLEWMSSYYLCSLRQAMRVFLPSNPWAALLPVQTERYQIAVPTEVRGKNQQAILEYLEQKESATWEEMREELGVSRNSLTPLVEKGILASESSSEFSTVHSGPIEIEKPTLTEAQKVAYESICSSNRPSLLFGVTGSGKTEVYAQLIADAIEQGKQAILLVPEILLTENSTQRFTQMLNDEHIAIIHSRLTPAQRRDEWKRVRFGNVKLVIGSRSALFAPVQNLGVVILDEEHEWTYKNEQTPRYHARETAEVLCKEFGAKLVLGSATPSIETWHRGKIGTYNVARLDDRYNNATLPTVKVVDLAQVEFGNDYPFSNTLTDAINERLAKGEQSVLFLNRRGVATSLLCLDCRRRVVSPDSNLPFTVHRTHSDKLYLQDHTTGAVAEVPNECPGCQSLRLRPVGAGTQRVEDIVRRKFPNARVLRADSDTLTHPEHMRLLLKKMKENQADILLGTQTVVKGLDLPNVTLAAVLVADVGMSLPHFRASERTFQLLTQLTGRSGRAAKAGEVIIQTFRPETPEVKMAALHETEKFLDYELALREQANYPPISTMARIILRGPDVRTRAVKLSAALQKHAGDHKIGCAPTLFGGGKEWHILIRGKDPKNVLKQADLTDTVVDIDPMDCV